MHIICPVTGVHHAILHCTPPCLLLQGCSGIKHFPTLQLKAAVGLADGSLGDWEGPPAWIAGARAAADPCVLNWTIDQADLAVYLTGGVAAFTSPLAYCNGAFFKCRISLEKEGEGANFVIGVTYEASEVARIARPANALVMGDKWVAVVNACVSLLEEDGSWRAICCDFMNDICSAAAPSWTRSSSVEVPEGGCTTEAEVLAMVSSLPHQIRIRVELAAK